jgi:hypothetical protein
MHACCCWQKSRLPQTTCKSTVALGRDYASPDTRLPPGPGWHVAPAVPKLGFCRHNIILHVKWQMMGWSACVSTALRACGRSAASAFTLLSFSCWVTVLLHSTSFCQSFLNGRLLNGQGLRTQFHHLQLELLVLVKRVHSRQLNMLMCACAVPIKS